MAKGKGKGKNTWETALLSVSLALLSVASLFVFHKVYDVQPTPYIDEIFHVPQAQLYCDNVWNKWDPKITTLPGLYLVSYIILKPFEALTNNFCSVYSLRLINVIGMLINFVVSYRILSKLHSSQGSKSLRDICTNLVSAINIAILPPLYFFAFLYYTDVWSVTFVLLMYDRHLEGTAASSKYIGAFFGLLSVIVRQTNIVWVGLMLGDAVWKELAKTRKSPKVQDCKFSIEVLKSLASYSWSKNKDEDKKRRSLFVLAGEVLTSAHSYLLVCVAFVGFIVLNGGIVVGDRAAHSVVFHPMQVLYFADFCAFFALPFFALEVLSVRKITASSVYVLMLGMGIAAALSEFNKLEHPYLLADNRHLAFYIWKRIFGHDVIRRAIVPTYVIALSLLTNLLDGCHFVFRVGLAACIFVNLSLQHLFELRYFVLPYVMCRLHFRRGAASAWFELPHLCLLNAFVVHVFANRSFSWSSEPGAAQRIVW